MIDAKKSLTDIVSQIRKTKMIFTTPLYIPGDGLVKHTGSVFKLCNLASKRAVELNSGMPPLIEMKAAKLATVALEEITQNKIKLKEGTTEE